MAQMVFKRYELKYLLSRKQYESIKKEIEEYMIPDKHGISTIYSLYLDTPNDLLIRRSMEGPVYKEKLRLRSYGTADENSRVYIELKKKYEGVVYKRREEMKCFELSNYLKNRKKPKETQIMNEIDYAMRRYKGIKPRMLLTYDREAFYGKNDDSTRVTFDQNIRYRTGNLSLAKPVYGDYVIDQDMVLMEVKVASAIPPKLLKIFEKNNIKKTSFSKYGTAYKLQKDKEYKEYNLVSGGI